MHVTIRALQSDDSINAGKIFFSAIHEGTKNHYNQEQREAWAGTKPDLEKWAKRLEGVFGFAAEINAEINAVMIGFMTLDEKGYIDLAFVDPAIIGKGVGQKLFAAIEQKAKQDHIDMLTTDASKKALPFFCKLGFAVEAEQLIEKNGVKITNYRMFKAIS